MSEIAPADDPHRRDMVGHEPGLRFGRSGPGIPGLHSIVLRFGVIEEQSTSQDLAGNCAILKKVSTMVPNNSPIIAVHSAMMPASAKLWQSVVVM